MPKKITDALSDAMLRGAKSGQREYRLNDGRGLVLAVKPSGARLWRLRYRYAGRERMLALGEYPDVGLKAARERAGVARDQVRNGIDPVQHRREERARLENAALTTFETIAEEWLAKREKRWTTKHIEQNRQSLRDYVYPVIGKRAISTLDAQDVMRVLNPLETAGKMETLRRVRQRVTAIFAYAVQTGRRTNNPAREIVGAYDAPDREHFASLGYQDLPEFLAGLEAYQGHPSTKAIVRMILWTACRTGEIRGATWDEIDLDAGIWTIPAARMKRRRAHVVPLPSQAVAMLRELRSVNTGDLAFASPMSPGQMASENVVLQAIRRMGYAGRTTGHGLRATVATGLEEKGYPGEIIRAQLSHGKKDLTEAAYLRGIHLERRTAMMAAWSDWLDGKTATIIPMVGAA